MTTPGPGDLAAELASSAATARRENPFTRLEYDPLKLLNRPDKVAAVFAVRDGQADFDATLPISVELHLTDLCNLKCPWCTDLALRENRASLPLPVVEQLFEELAAGGVGITIEGGGEPTIHKHFPAIVAAAQTRGLHLGLITNGVRPLVDVAPAFRWIRVSIDAASPDEYLIEKGVQRFEVVMENLAALAALPGREFLLGVGYVITRRNLEHLTTFLERLDEIGVDYAYLRPVEEMPDLVPDLAQLYELKAAWETRAASGRRLEVLMGLGERLERDNAGLPCIAHALSCIIHANGDVAMCEKRRHDPIVYGNLNQHSFAEIWRGTTRREASRRLLDAANQQGCEVCRITRFNKNFYALGRLRTRAFI